MSLVSRVSLEVYPRKAEFMAFGGATKHVLVNKSYTRIAVKVKCSNNHLYKVSPVYSFIDPGGSRDLEIVRNEGEARIDKLVLIYKRVLPDDEDPKTAFLLAKDCRKVVLPLIVLS